VPGQILIGAPCEGVFVPMGARPIRKGVDHPEAVEADREATNGRGSTAAVAVGALGGRLFGFGLWNTKNPNNVITDQLFRIDYWDGLSVPPLVVHYHLFQDQTGFFLQQKQWARLLRGLTVASISPRPGQRKR
jgi:hypothetical protein